MRRRRARDRLVGETPTRHVISTSEGPDLEFDGVRLLSETHACVGEISIYRTRAGAIVASQSIDEDRSGRVRTRAAILRSVADLPSWLGYTVGIKQILARLGYPSRTWVD